MKRARTACLISVLILLSFPIVVFAGVTPVHITILHVNDVHGHVLPYLELSISEKTPVGGAADLAAMIKRERDANPDGNLLLSAGDMFQGTPVSNIFRGRSVIDVMNYLKFDAMVLGNHEFDWGRDALNDLRSWASFPFLSANIFDGNGKILPGIQPYIILTRKNLKIAVIGITTVVGLTYQEPLLVLPDVIKKVKDQGANLVVALSHLGLDEDKELAGQVSGIDVIVGGHSHTAVTEPVQIGKTIIVQAGYNGLYLGVLNLEVDPSKNEVLRYTKKDELKTVFACNDNPFDAKLAGIVDKYEKLIRERERREVIP